MHCRRFDSACTKRFSRKLLGQSAFYDLRIKLIASLGLLLLTRCHTPEFDKNSDRNSIFLELSISLSVRCYGNVW